MAALAGILAVVVAAVVDDRPRTLSRPIPAPAAGPALPPSELAGRWSGTGSLTDCAGFDDCPRTPSLTLAISCPGESCTVTAVGRGAGSPPLRFEAGRYRAAGPVRAEVAPACVGAPSTSAMWRLDLVVSGGRLVGSYEQSTGQSLNCGATSVEWSVTLART
ncbi:hypothetical protein [Modestobacter sp. I12A-02662]|uniref:hypothetical protein n=1 Tax=Modestobacter sp. I12A-02662 TaxID=1730496 RepID=UPI0034DF6662